MTHHTLVIWALCTGCFSLPIYAIICGLSFLAGNVSGAMRIVKDILTKAENKIEDILE